MAVKRAAVLHSAILPCARVLMVAHGPVWASYIFLRTRRFFDEGRLAAIHTARWAIVTLGPFTSNKTSQVLQHVECGMGVKCQARLRSTRSSDRAEIFTCNMKTDMQWSLQISQTSLLWNSYLSCSVIFRTSQHGMSPCGRSNALAARDREAARSLHIHRLQIRRVRTSSKQA